MTATFENKKIGTVIKIFDDWHALEDRIARLIARSWLDPEFCRSVVADPERALASVGVSVGDDVEIEIDRDNITWSVICPVERGKRRVAIFRLPLPPRPATLADEDLHRTMQGDSDVIFNCGWCC